MQVHASYVEYVLGTVSAMLKDIADRYPDSAKSFERDEKRLRLAVENHGIEFFLVTMPSFRKHFDKCLSEARLTRCGLIHFGPTHRRETVPRLFQGLTLRVFNRDGSLVIHPDPHAIRALRQILGFARKLRLDCGILNRRKAVVEFFRIDGRMANPSQSWKGLADDDQSFDASFEVSRQEVDTLPLFRGPRPEDKGGSDPRLLRRAQQSADLVAALLGDFSPLSWRTRHGPGVVSDLPQGMDKYSFPSWSARLEGVFPSEEFAFANSLEWADAVRTGKVPQEIEVPVKLCGVPKTLTKPRLIAVESVANQWCQQAIRDFLYTRVRETPIGWFISFDDQSKNGDLALEASHSQSHSTIDLSDASDRISCYLVDCLFRRSPSILRALRATRARWMRQDICGYSPKLYELRKYSTMGNATTFPVQSLLFLVLALACELHVRDLPVNLSSLRKLREVKVRVFGDDIISPSTSSGLLVELLHHLGLKVNTSKTFETGKFRESCGVDAYDGQDVTTVSIMDVPRRAAPASVVSTVDVHNNLIRGGWFRTAAYVQNYAVAQGFTKIHVRKHGAGSFGWDENPLRPYSQMRKRVNRDSQTLEIQSLMLFSKEHRITAEGGPGLLQFFTEASKVVTSAVSTLGHLVRRPQTTLRLGWVPY